MIASNDDAREDLFQYFQDFVKCVLEAQAELGNALVPESRAKARTRSISGLMNDFATHNLRACFTGRPGVKLNERNGQTKLIFNSKYLVKCKKSVGGRLSFANTQLMLNFMQQYPFPDMPSPITNIVLTYELNPTRTEIVKIALLCPANKNKYHWDIPLAKASEFLPVPPMQEKESPKPPTPPKRVVPKDKKQRKPRKMKGPVSKHEQDGEENQPRNGGGG